MTLLLRIIPNGYHVLPRGQPIAQDIAKGSGEEAPQLQQIPQACAYRTRYDTLISHAVNNLSTELSLDRYAALPGAVQLEGDPRGAGLPSRCLREVPAPGRPPGPVQAQSPCRAEAVRRGAPNQRCASALCMGQPLTAVCPARTRFIVFSSLSLPLVGRRAYRSLFIVSIFVCVLSSVGSCTPSSFCTTASLPRLSLVLVSPGSLHTYITLCFSVLFICACGGRTDIYLHPHLHLSVVKTPAILRSLASPCSSTILDVTPPSPSDLEPLSSALPPLSSYDLRPSNPPSHPIVFRPSHSHPHLLCVCLYSLPHTYHRRRCAMPHRAHPRAGAGGWPGKGYYI